MSQQTVPEPRRIIYQECMRKYVRRVSPEIIGMYPLVETITTRLASITSGATAELRGEVPRRRIKTKAAICSAPAK